MILKMVRIHIYIFHRRLLTIFFLIDTKCHNINTSKIKRQIWWKNQDVHEKEMSIHNLQKEEKGETQTSDPCFLKRWLQSIGLTLGGDNSINRGITLIHWCWMCRSNSEIIEQLLLHWDIAYEIVNFYFLCIQGSLGNCTFFLYCNFPSL